MTTPDAVHAWLADHRDELIRQLMEWVRIPSVAGAAEHEVDLRRSARWLAGALRDVGFPRVETWTAKTGAPTVWAEWPGPPGAPVVLVYSHHDVRTAKPELWDECPPFEPACRNGRLYGRGASDAKGQVLAHLFGWRACLGANGGRPPVTLRLLVEGEEETGSAGLADLLAEHRDQTRADLAVLSDTMTWSADEPAVCIGGRGRVQAELEVRGPLKDVHAGAVSGAAPNPSTELVRLLAGLHDADGRVAIPGFYDRVRDATAAEREELARLTADTAAWVERTRTRAVVGERGRTLGERLYTRPSADVLSLAAGDPVGPTRGAIPSVATAQVLVSLVPDQDVAEVSDLLRAWVAENLPDYVEHTLTVTETTRQAPYVTPPDHPALDVLAEAMGDAWGRPAGWMRNAGSAPAALLAEATGGPVLFFGTGLPEDGWHDSDESVHLGVLVNGAVTLGLFWDRVAGVLTPAGR